MSERLLVAKLQGGRIPASLNICPTDERFFQWLNEAEELMLNQGRWWGSVAEAQFCTQESDCITWPRQVAGVEQIRVNGHALSNENGWYDYTRLLAPGHGCAGGCRLGWSGTGRNGVCACGHLQAVNRVGTVASFATTRGASKVLRFYPGGSADVGKKLIVQGRDSNGIWVRTSIDGVIQDGEQVALALPFVDTVTVWGDGAPAAVVKEVTAWRVMVYEYDTVTLAERAIAIYEPGETAPSYRTSYVPGLRNVRGGGCSGSEACSSTITALVSLQHVDVSSPGDWLVLQNAPAYKAAMMAVKAWEEGDEAKGNYYFYGSQAGPSNARGVLRVVNRGGAIPLLEAELKKNGGGEVSAYVYVDESERFARQMAGFR